MGEVTEAQAKNGEGAYAAGLRQVLEQHLDDPLDYAGALRDYISRSGG